VAVPPELASKLRESIGAEGAEVLVSWVHEMRIEAEQHRAAIHADFAEFRQEMRTEFAAFRLEMRSEFAAFRQETRDMVHASEMRLTERIHTLDTRISEVQSNLMKWSFVFWCGAVAAIAALAGVLR